MRSALAIAVVIAPRLGSSRSAPCPRPVSGRRAARRGLSGVARGEGIPPRDRLGSQAGSEDETSVRCSGALSRNRGRGQARLVGELRLCGPQAPAQGLEDDAVSRRQCLEDADRGDDRAAEPKGPVGRGRLHSRLRHVLPTERPGADPAPARRSPRRHPPLPGCGGDQHAALQLGHRQPPRLRRRPARRPAGRGVSLLELRLQPPRRGRRDGHRHRVRTRRRRDAARAARP